MSHVARVNCIIKDLDVLGEAAEKLGGELVRDQKRFHFYAGATEPCVHALKVKGAKDTDHEVGLRQKSASDPEEGFEPHYDVSFAGNINRAFGSNLVELRKEYSAAMAERQLRKQGYMVRRDTEAQANEIRLVATR